jgi:alkylhydroperoxidase family enzyme
MAVRAAVRHDVPPPAAPDAPAEILQWRGVGPLAFTPLEEQVIALAHTDGPASLEAPGLVERMLKTIFGLRGGTRALADPRLEALRRAVVVTRHRHHLPDAQAAALRDVGYAPTQIRMIEARAVAG